MDVMDGGFDADLERAGEDAVAMHIEDTPRPEYEVCFGTFMRGEGWYVIDTHTQWLYPRKGDAYATEEIAQAEADRMIAALATHADTCTCEIEDDGDPESGPHLSVSQNPECTLHGRAAQPEEWAAFDAFDMPYPPSLEEGR